MIQAEEAPLPKAETWSLRLPDPVTSFGACEVGGYLYVYGGHVGEAHQYSEKNHSLKFSRVNLRSRKQWESLPMDVPMQSGIIVGFEGKVYRVGGSQATNKVGEPSNLRSLDSFAIYDPEKRTWAELTPLPEPRSSHEAVIHDGKLYVVGGWNMGNGLEYDKQWHRHGLVADLYKSPIQWERLPEADWIARANSCGILNGKLYVIGGLDGKGTSNTVRVFDLKDRVWSQGPDLPAKGSLKGFGSAAVMQAGRLHVCGYTPFPWRLTRESTAWEKAGFRLDGRRFFQRMVAHGERGLLFLGGADPEGHTDLIESFNLPESSVPLRNSGTIWPGFRGDGTSNSPAKDLPMEWSDDKNIAWRAPLKGYGQSSPVAWMGRVFTTSKEGDHGETLVAQCHGALDGKLIWTKTFPVSNQIKRSGYVSLAAPTPVVDADGFYVFWETGDLIALTHAGKSLWQRNLTKDFGPLQGNHGIGSSLFQSLGRLGLLIDHDGPSYLLCIDKSSGKDVWKTDRPRRVSWSTPTLDGETLVVSSNGVLEAYDFSNGKRLWQLDQIEGNTVAAPTVTEDLVIIGSSVRGNCFAVSRNGRHEKAWALEETTSSFGSPLVANGRVYFVNRAGIAFCHDHKSGRKLWHKRIAGSCWASPVLADGRIYFFSKEGGTTVLNSDGSEKVLAENTLTITSRIYGVAVLDGIFLVRTGSELICIAK